MTAQQVVRAEGWATAPRREFWDQEPIFWTSHSHLSLSRVGIQGEGLLERLGHYLAHRISRFPLDLPSHTHRILLHSHRRDADAVWGALIDLFIALGPMDRGYREHALNLARGLLDGPRLATLRARLDGWLSPSDVLPPAAHSVLSRSYEGPAQLVTRTATTVKHRTALAEARDLIDAGRLHAAQTLLEQALLSDPRDEAIGLELLDLYRYTGDRTSMVAMQARLQTRAPDVAQTWAAAAALFTVG